MNARGRFLILAAAGAGAFGLGRWCAGPSREFPPPAVAEHAPAVFTAGAQEQRSFEDLLGPVLSAALEDDPLARCRALTDALADVTEAQAIPLLERIGGLSETYRDQLLHPVFARLCRLYPDAVTPWVLRLPRARGRSLSGYRENGEILSTWARLVPDTALSIAQEDPLGFAHIFARRSSPGDGASEPATIGFDSLPPGPLRERAAAFYAAGTYKNVADAWRVGRAEVHGELRIEAAFKLASTGLSLYEADPAAVLDMLADIAPELPGGLFGHNYFNTLVGRATGRIEPDDVADWALRLPEALRVPAAIAAASAWAGKAPLEALVWAWDRDVPLERENGESNGRQSILKTALVKSPDETVAWLASLPPGVKRARLIAYACADDRLNDERQAALRR